MRRVAARCAARAARRAARRLRRADARSASPTVVSPAPAAVEPAPQAAERGRARRRRAHRGRHPRPGVEPVLGDRPQRRRGRGAPDGRRSSLPRARRLQPRAHERADRPGGRRAARRARRLDPRARASGPRSGARSSAGIPVVSINSGSDVCAPPRRARPRRPARGRAPGFEAGERLAAAGVRRALCVNQQVGNHGLDARCAALARAMRAAGGSVARARRRRPEPARRRAGSPRRSARAASTACWRLNATGGDARRSRRRRARRRAARVEARDVRPRRPTSCAPSRAGRLLFAVDQQAYLQGYLPSCCSPSARATASSPRRAT